MIVLNLFIHTEIHAIVWTKKGHEWPPSQKFNRKCCYLILYLFFPIETLVCRPWCRPMWTNQRLFWLCCDVYDVKQIWQWNNKTKNPSGFEFKMFLQVGPNFCKNAIARKGNIWMLKRKHEWTSNQNNKGNSLIGSFPGFTTIRRMTINSLLVIWRKADM